MKLFYKQPAAEWEQTLPLGNGNLGAMVWGKPSVEQIGLNDDYLWSGYPHFKENPSAIQSIEEIKQLLLDKQRVEAQQLIRDAFLGDFTDSYLPLGNLFFTFDQSDRYTEYKRELNIKDSIASVAYETDEGTHAREYFVSHPDRSLRGRFNFPSNTSSLALHFETKLMTNSETVTRGKRLTVKVPEHVEPVYVDTDAPVHQGSKGASFTYEWLISDTDGKVTIKDKAIQVENASYVEWLFRKESSDAVQAYASAKEEHLADYRSLFNKVELDLGPQLDFPTDERLARLKSGEEDPGMVALYFQYGRYLLISSSRPGSLPANLQGIWNWELQAPWSSNWTTNINSAMNYWGVDTCNLSECFEPYTEFVDKIKDAGRRTAREYYGIEGSVCHHNTDRWYHTNPVGRPYGADKAVDGAEVYAMWPMALLWMAADLYRHYEYNPDELYLYEHVFPVLRETVAFIVNFVTLKDGVYHTVPSTSPENSFFDEQGNICSVDKSVTMDLTMIQEIFDFYQQSCEILEIQGDYLTDIEAIRADLAEIKVGSKGQVLEWQEEFEEVEPGHRHFSHLYGAYPSEVFDDSLLEATQNTLEIRKQYGSGHTGWSNAWLVNLYAVLKDGETAYEHVLHGIAEASYDNLWSSHPPFQIDGNFGMMAGIANLFVQDRHGKVDLLPALPKALSAGYVKGLRIKGNQEVEIRWENGQIITSEISEVQSNRK